VSADIYSGAGFRAPVFVRIGHGPCESIYSPVEALDYLTNRWPPERGQHYLSAVYTCREASEARLPAEIAREAFTAAAIEAWLIS
jgi:hypothetical protein